MSVEPNPDYPPSDWGGTLWEWRDYLAKKEAKPLSITEIEQYLLFKKADIQSALLYKILKELELIGAHLQGKT